MNAETEPNGTVICSSCGSANPANQQACTQCGSPLPAVPVLSETAPAPAPEATPAPAEPEPASVQAGERGGCLSIWLILSMLGGLLSLAGVAIAFSFFGLEDQTLPATLVSIAYGAGAFGIWKWKKWGLYLYVAAAAAALLIIAATTLLGDYDPGAALGSMAIWAIGMGIFYALVKPIYPHLT
jgi:hypothetical protein